MFLKPISEKNTRPITNEKELKKIKIKSKAVQERFTDQIIHTYLAGLVWSRNNANLNLYYDGKSERFSRHNRSDQCGNIYGKLAKLFNDKKPNKLTRGE